MLFLVKIGTVASDQTAFARVQITIKNKIDLTVLHYLNYMEPIGKSGNKFWFHFKSAKHWGNFYREWIKLEKPFEMNLNPWKQRFYTIKSRSKK